MNIREFLNTVCKEIKYKPVRNGIAEELKIHIEDIKEDYMNSGMEEQEAEEKAVAQMGTAEEIGRQLNKIHRPKLDWKLLLLIAILIGFGLFVAVLKQSVNYNYIVKTIIYMIVGVGLSVGIYFFDYKKIKNYNDIIYIFTSIIMILPMTSIGYTINGIYHINILNISIFPPTITLPLYLIAFIGYIVNYNKDNAIKIQIQNKEFSIINRDFLKIITLSIISIILMIKFPSIINAVILGIAYLVVTTVKIIKDKEKCIKKLIIMYGVLGVVTALISFQMLTYPGAYRLKERIMGSFHPEIDSIGVGYVGTLQKEILQNAKLIGEADTSIISNEELIVNSGSNFTFIYLLGKTGILVSGILVLTILLTCVRLITNAKNIKEQYGKFLIIGLSTCYILQSITTVLMNLNMGIQTSAALPFVAYGGVYFIVNILSIAIVLSVYRRKDINIYDGT